MLENTELVCGFCALNKEERNDLGLKSMAFNFNFHNWRLISTNIPISSQTHLSFSDIVPNDGLRNVDAALIDEKRVKELGRCEFNTGDHTAFSFDTLHYDDLAVEYRKCLLLTKRATLLLGDVISIIKHSPLFLSQDRPNVFFQEDTRQNGSPIYAVVICYIWTGKAHEYKLQAYEQIKYFDRCVWRPRIFVRKEAIHISQSA